MKYKHATSKPIRRPIIVILRDGFEGVTFYSRNDLIEEIMTGVIAYAQDEDTGDIIYAGNPRDLNTTYLFHSTAWGD